MEHFYSRPCGRGDRPRPGAEAVREDFYSRPCGRGDAVRRERSGSDGKISTHAPAGGATPYTSTKSVNDALFLLTPLREGRPSQDGINAAKHRYFYSRPCGRGDTK